MAVQNKVSLPVIKRLPKYYRYLTNLSADGKDKISSSELAHMMGTTASQVRQDFNCFGGFGQQGIGYKVDVLRTEIGNLLFGDGEKLPTIWSVPDASARRFQASSAATPTATGCSASLMSTPTSSARRCAAFPSCP